MSEPSSLGYSLYGCYAKITPLTDEIFTMNESAGNTITLDDFNKVDMRVASIISAKPNEGARKPAYVLLLDFGEELGEKTTSAQITDLYTCDELIGRQVIAVVNFPAIRIAGVKSEVLVLGVLGDAGVTLLAPGRAVANGAKIA